MTNIFMSASTPTLADVRTRIMADGDISSSRCAAIGSAVNTFCRVLGMQPEMVPANLAFIRGKLQSVSPAAAGVTDKRFSTVKSDVLFALRHLGMAAPGTYLAPMTGEWGTLWGRLPDKYARTVFSRFFRYCSARGVEPAAVDDLVTTQFLQALTDETLVKDPRVNHQNLCRVWNRMRGLVPGWPGVTLTERRYADHYTLPWSSFPVSFREDVEAYLARLGNDDILDLSSPPRPLKPRTLKAYQYELRRFASALVHQGHEARCITSLAYLVDLKHVEQGLRFLLKRNGDRPMPSAADLATLLGKVAKYWVRAPAESVAMINRYARRVRPSISGLGAKNRKRLVPLRDERNLARLFLLPNKIRKEIEKNCRLTRADALLMQYAVALIVLTYAPIRISNLAALHVEKNLRWSGREMGGTLVIDIDGASVKNGQTLSFPLPPICADLVRLYLREYQPRLAIGGSPYLFPSDLPGRPKRADTLGKQLTRLIWRTIGLEVNPHLYRHLVHLIVLNRYPGAYAMVSRVLGHKSLQTAISNYAGEDIAIAMRAFQDLIAATTAGQRSPRDGSAIAYGLNGRNY
jgi:integrase